MRKRLFLCFLCFLTCSCLCSHLVSSSSFSNSSKPLSPYHQALSLLRFTQSFSLDNSSSWGCYENGGITSYPKTESWKEGRDCCTWDGVTCDGITGHVIELDLSCSWLHGGIPSDSSLFLFPHLRSLNLAFNDFAGFSVSAGFGYFSSLMHLNLSESEFSGNIAPEIFQLSNLVSLDLSGNSEAKIASHDDFNSMLQNFTKLQKLDLGGISISSVFPNSLLNLSSLISLDLSRCGLRGRFPDHDLHLPNLEVLDLGENYNLGGNFPRFSENNSLLELSLSETNFSGELPTSIGNLKSLKTLGLWVCGFSGSIPPSLQNLTQLTHLELAWNHFSDKIPNVFSIICNLTRLDLSSNNFTGHLPPSIWNLTNLQSFDCSDNKFQGALPSHVNGFPSLQVIDLTYNLLNGTIPPWLYALPTLEVLHLCHNKLTGRIGEFQSHSSLEAVDLSMNELYGPIPSSIFELVNLAYLNLSTNYLSGTLGATKFHKLRNLHYIYLSNNSLQGSLPALPTSIVEFLASDNKLSGSLPALPTSIVKFSASNNKLSGSIPALPDIILSFSASNNKLSGELSPSICKVGPIFVLDLSNNNLSGQLPPCLGNCSTVILHNNQFSGTIPQTYFTENTLRNLDLNANQLEGPLPRSLILCRTLEVLNLGNNKINDTFPLWLATLPKLQVLILRSNSFHGLIGASKIKSPFMSLRIIDLAYNNFIGHLPEMYLRSFKAITNGNQDNMEGMYMEHYQGYHYEDSVEVTIKGLEIEFVKILKTFTTIDLSCNKFQGEIPTCIGSLNYLRALNLSHNNLTGYIPPSLENLKLLESLDLSSNKLIGRIPQQLTSLMFLEVLNLSQNCLTGLIPRGPQFDTFGNDSYNGNFGLCGTPLSKKCIDDGTTKLPNKSDAKLDDKFDWRTALMGYGCGLVFGLSLGCIIFLTGEPEWLVWIIDDNINKIIMRYERSPHRPRARRN